MKRWNTPEIEAIEINKTENGFFNCEYECCVWTNDSKKKQEEDPEDPQEDTES